MSSRAELEGRHPWVIPFELSLLIPTAESLGMSLEVRDRGSGLFKEKELAYTRRTKPGSSPLGPGTVRQEFLIQGEIATRFSLAHYYDHFTSSAIQAKILGVEEWLRDGKLDEAVLSQFVMNEYGLLTDLKEGYKDGD